MSVDDWIDLTSLFNFAYQNTLLDNLLHMISGRSSACIAPWR